ncbi:MAG: alanine racemase [Alphaproteobacteria bacterium]|nr:alanine racemase [Alphaproteobacteria bacterium]
MISEAERAGAELVVDLGAVVANWRALRRMVGPRVDCAAVVKADAYSLGMVPVARALAVAGCRSFFVATPDEGTGLRRVLGRHGAIAVLHGVPPGAEGFFARHRLTPVINDLGALERWGRHARARGRAAAAYVHMETGLNRLAMPAADVERLIADPAPLRGLAATWMGHLACADDAESPMNRAQLDRFRGLLARLPKGAASFVASSGIALGRDYTFDQVRPGYALFGGDLAPGARKMRPVVRLRARILQVRRVDTPGTVGYGAAHRVTGLSRIATVPVGYADGYRRSLSGRAQAAIGTRLYPVVGRISMDLTTIDVTEAPANTARPGAWVDLIGRRAPIDTVGAWAGTIGYEILTGLGRRFPRRYVGGPDGA